MNKQSNLYTLIYIVVLVVLVGTALAFTSISLKDRQKANADADKMRQILASVNIYPPADSIISDFDKYITDRYIINSEGNRIESSIDAFTVKVDLESKKAPADRMLPLYVCTLDNGDIKYIIPLHGAGLWGPIWGYISVDDNGSTIYGAYFAHQGETPGLGAEIEKPSFSSQFIGHELIKAGKFLPIDVVKAGQHPADDRDYVDAISGATITSKGVGQMADNCLAPYAKYLTSLSENSTR